MKIVVAQHNVKFMTSATTEWTNVNLLYFPDSIEIASLEGLTFWWQEINQSGHWHGDARFSWLEDNDLPLSCRHCLFLTCSHRDNSIFNGTSEIRSKT